MKTATQLVLERRTKQFIKLFNGLAPVIQQDGFDIRREWVSYANWQRMQILIAAFNTLNWEQKQALVALYEFKPTNDVLQYILAKGE